MIAKNLRVNNEFYVAPVYNELIAEGARIAIHNVGREGAGMYGLGIPRNLEGVPRRSRLAQGGRLVRPDHDRVAPARPAQPLAPRRGAARHLK